MGMQVLDVSFLASDAGWALGSHWCAAVQDLL